MWIEPKGPYMWDGAPSPDPDIGDALINGTSLFCGENRHNLSTVLSTGKGLLSSIHILERLLDSSHIWGYGFTDKIRRF